MGTDVTIVDRDQFLRELDEQGDSLRQESFTARDQLIKFLQADFATKVESFHSVG